jgi:hypothetical protein
MFGGVARVDDDVGHLRRQPVGSGKASRALTARFMMTDSSWLASTFANHRPMDYTTSSCTVSLNVRESMSDILATS